MTLPGLSEGGSLHVVHVDAEGRTVWDFGVLSGRDLRYALAAKVPPGHRIVAYELIESEGWTPVQR